VSIKPVFNSDEYGDGRTKQAFKDQTDINKILAKAQRTGTISHLAKYQGEYGDFTDVDDLLTAYQRLERGNQIFSELPSEVRAEFKQDPASFFKFVNDPANIDRLDEVLPQLAKPGTQLPDVLGKTGGAAAASEPQASETKPTASPTEGSGE